MKKNKEYRQLKKKWDDILKKDDFKDIEPYDSNSSIMLKKCNEKIIRGLKVFKEKAEYLDGFRDFFWEYDWENERDRFIFEGFIDGKSASKISKELQEKKGLYYSREWVRKIIKKYVRIKQIYGGIYGTKRT